jgi:hypothetical protein
MADPGAKKVTVLKSDIVLMSGADQSYTIRYRVVSEDKNRTSHWSPQYKLSLTPLDPIVSPRPHVVTVANGAINCVWEQTQGLSAEKYDVYINWATDPAEPVWEYSSTVTSPSFQIIKRSTASKVQIAVQVPTFPKERFTGSTLFVSAQYSV